MVSKQFLNNKKNLDKHIKEKLRFNTLRKKNYESLLNFTIKAAKENPNTTFVFRRHPIESEEYIKISLSTNQKI